jgi:hypothetical protein
MNIDLISSIARCHRDDVLRRAAHERRGRKNRGERRSLRGGLAIAARNLGNAFLNLGDALAERAR